MENSTKALVICGAILIAIVIVAFGIKLLTSANSLSIQSKDVSDELDSSTRDKSYEVYKDLANLQGLKLEEKTWLGTSSAPLTINNTTEGTVKNYRIYGACSQSGTPTPNNPIEVQCVGDLETVKGKQKYKISVTATNIDKTKTKTIDIYLDEPLRRIVYYSRIAEDYVDFNQQRVFRSVEKVTITGNEKITDNNYNRPDYNDITIRYIKLSNANPVYYGGWWSNQYTYLHALWNYNNFGTDKAWKFCYLNGSKEICLSISNDNETMKINEEDSTKIRTEKFREYIKSNPFYILYPTITREAERIIVPELPTFEGGTIYTIETILKPSKFEIEVEVKE